MTARVADRVLVGIPGPLGRELRQRAKLGYRSLSNEVTMLIERGLAAEKAASNHTA